MTRKKTGNGTRSRRFNGLPHIGVTPVDTTGGGGGRRNGLMGSIRMNSNRSVER